MRFSLLCIVALPLLFAGSAQAWEIKTTGAGLPVRWPGGSIDLDLSMGAESFAISRSAGDAEALAAFTAWDRAAGSELRFALAPGQAELLPTARDGRNVIRWGTDPDDPHVDPEALATTYLTYRTTTGEILEADIVVNAVDYEWTAGHCDQRYDLQNIMAHEIGHFVGLGHSSERDSTMFPSAGRCETKKRELSTDDEEAASYLYEDLRLEAGAGVDPIVGCASGGSSGLLGALLVLGILWRRRVKSAKEEPWEAYGIDSVIVKRALGRARAPRRVHRTMRWLMLAPLAWVMPSSAQASGARELGPAELVARADLIVHGQIVAQEVRLEAGWPVTVSRLEVARCDLAHCPAQVEVSQLGGELGDLGLLVSGVRMLVVGSEVVLFAERRGDSLRPVAKSQGIFDVLKRGSQTILARDLQHVGCSASSEIPKLAKRACQEPSSGDLATLNWSQFEEIFGSKLLK